LNSKVNPGVRPGERTVSTVALINLHVNTKAKRRVAKMGVEDEQGRLFFKLCSDHLSIEAIPRKTVHVNLNELKDRVILGHELMLWTPHFLVLRNRAGQEITLRKDGRMIIRKAGSELLAKRAAEEVMNAVSRVS
jgi:hypothetical protein